MKKTATERAAALTAKKPEAKPKGKSKGKRMGPTTRRKLFQQAAELGGRLAAFEEEHKVHHDRAAASEQQIREAAFVRDRAAEEMARIDSAMKGVRIAIGKLNVRLGKK